MIKLGGKRKQTIQQFGGCYVGRSVVCAPFVGCNPVRAIIPVECIQLSCANFVKLIRDVSIGAHNEVAVKEIQLQCRLVWPHMVSHGLVC